MKDSPETITAKVRSLRKRAGMSMSEVAKAMGFRGASSYQRYEDASQLKPGYLSRDFVASFDSAVSGKGTPPISSAEVWELAGPEFATTHDEPERSSDASTKQIPDLAIHAGMGGGGLIEISADEHGAPTNSEEVRGFWTFPDYMIRSLGNLRSIYAWEVRGDSMEPTLPGGSVVFVDTSQCDPRQGDIFAIDYGDGLMVKRLKLVPQSEMVSVISDNEMYGADELLREGVMVYGRVIGWFQWRG